MFQEQELAVSTFVSKDLKVTFNNGLCALKSKTFCLWSLNFACILDADMEGQLD